MFRELPDLNLNNILSDNRMTHAYLNSVKSLGVQF